MDGAAAAPAEPPRDAAVADNADALASALERASLEPSAAAPAEREETEEERAKCRVCNVQPRSVLLVACGHFLTCLRCHQQIMARAQRCRPKPAHAARAQGAAQALKPHTRPPTRRCMLCRTPVLSDVGWRVTEPAGTGLAPVRSFQPEAVVQDVVIASGAPDANVAACMARIIGDDAAAHFEATLKLRRLLSRDDPEELCDTVTARRDVVARLIAFLEDGTRVELQFEAAWVLTNLSCGAPRHAAALTRAGALPPLVRALGSPSADVAEQAAWCLGNLAADMPRAVLTAGAMLPLLALLADDAVSGVSMRRNVTWSIINLCKKTPLEQVTPALPTLVRMLHTEADEACLDHACCSLRHITTGDGSARMQAFLDVGGAEACARLVALLGRPEEGHHVGLEALLTLSNICTGDSEQTGCVLRAGALPALVRLLRDPAQPEKVHKECCFMVSNIVADSAHVQAALDAGVVAACTEQLRHDSWRVRREAMWVISNAAEGTPKQVKSLVDLGAVPRLCSALSTRDGDDDEERTLEVGLAGLRLILHAGSEVSGNPYAQLVRRGVPDLQARLQELRHRPGAAAELAANIVDAYFPDWAEQTAPPDWDAPDN